MKPKLLLLLLIFSSCTLALYVNYKMTIGADKIKTGFNRKLLADKAWLLVHRNLDEKNDYLAGVAGKNIYLANTAPDGKIMVIDTNLKTVKYLPINDSIYWPSTEVSLANNSLIAADRETSEIRKFDLTTFKQSSYTRVHRHTLSIWSFDTASYILKVFNPKLQQFTLITFPDKSEHEFIPLKHDEGTFSTDGMLLHNTDENCLLYVYYYQNKIIKLDSNLHVTGNYRTIDTTNFLKNKLGIFSGGTTRTFERPASFVNRKACTYQKFILIYSGRQGDNETNKIFDQNFPLDVYDVITGKYLFSFYIPKLGHKQITGMMTSAGKLFLTYRDEALGVFKLNF